MTELEKLLEDGWTITLKGGYNGVVLGKATRFYSIGGGTVEDFGNTLDEVLNTLVARMKAQDEYWERKFQEND